MDILLCYVYSCNVYLATIKKKQRGGLHWSISAVTEVYMRAMEEQRTNADLYQLTLRLLPAFLTAHGRI